MSKRLLLLLAVLSMFLLAACNGDGDNVAVTTSPATPNVSVSGRGEVQVASDTGYIDVGVSVTAATVAEARDRSARAADAVINSVKQNGVDARDIKTTNLQIQPQYVYPQNGGQPTITGYIVTNIVNAKVRNLDNFSKVVDDATAAGGDDARVNSIRFDVDDNEEALQQAREAAMADAKKKADELARLGGVTLGKPIAITEVEGTNPPVLMADAAFGSRQTGAPATPIEPGSGTVVVNLTVTWAIEG